MDLSELKETLCAQGCNAAAKDHYLKVSPGGLASPINITFDYSTRQLTYTYYAFWMALVGVIMLANGAVALSSYGGYSGAVLLGAGAMQLLCVVITEIRLVELRQLINSLKVL